MILKKRSTGFFQVKRIKDTANELSEGKSGAEGVYKELGFPFSGTAHNQEINLKY